MREGMGKSPLLQVSKLKVYFPGSDAGLLGRHEHPVRAVDEVDLEIYPGQSVGLVGESGSGKTTLGKALLRLVGITSGQVFFKGRDITGVKGSRLAGFRREVQMIHQDTHASLSPRMRVRDLLIEPYRIHRVSKTERRSVDDLLDMVGLKSELAAAYPHELSGGQARRVGIARILCLNPTLVVADEPTAGLDTSAAAGILNLMRDLSKRLGITYIVITHDLSIVGFLAERTAVMYLGRIIETGETTRIFKSPAHPYTRLLLSSLLKPVPRSGAFEGLVMDLGEMPSPRFLPKGCRYQSRCPLADEKCRSAEPLLESIRNDYSVACHYPDRESGISR